MSREAMQMALETAEQIACADYRHWEDLASLSEFERWARSRANHIADALRTALAETDVPETAFGETEPVAWTPKIERLYDKNGFLLHQKIKRTPSSEWEDYYPEPQREWQGLTDEELDQAMDYWSDPSRSAYGGADRADGEYVDMKDTWRYIEEALRRKNT